MNFTMERTLSIALNFYVMRMCRLSKYYFNKKHQTALRHNVRGFKKRVYPHTVNSKLYSKDKINLIFLGEVFN